MRQLLIQRIQTPDGTILNSSHRHDYVEHHDKVSGEMYMIDGGSSYRRGSINSVKAKDLSVYDDEPHEIIREAFEWGTRGISGQQPLKYVELKNLDTDHIEAILETQYQISAQTKKVFLDELSYRGVEIV